MSVARAIVYSPRQVGNPVLKAVRDVPLELGDKNLKVDFLVSETCGVLFLSMKYNSLHPEYVYKRIEGLGSGYQLRILLVVVDIENPTDTLTGLTKMCILRDLALITSWSFEEAATYLGELKARSKATNQTTAPLSIQKKASETYEDQLVDVLTRVPRVNKPDVLGLANHYKSFQNIVRNANSVEHLEGWGPTKSAKFKRALHEPFSMANPMSDEQAGS